MMKLSPAVD